MQTFAEMTTSDLQSLLNDADARIREQGALMSRTPADTVAYKAMAESRPGLLKFRQAIDDELDRRGA